MIEDWDAVRQERLGRFVAENRVERLSHDYEVLFDLLKQGGAAEEEIRDYTVAEGESASTTPWCGGYGKLKHQAR